MLKIYSILVLLLTEIILFDNFAVSLVKTKIMAENCYQVRNFKPVNNEYYQFQEVAVNGKFLLQEFINNLKDKQKDMKKLYSIYGYMDQFSPHCLLPKTKFRSVEGRQCKNLFEFKKGDIRVYVILKKPSVFVILGAYKGTQNHDYRNIDKLFKDFNTD